MDLYRLDESERPDETPIQAICHAPQVSSTNFPTSNARTAGMSGDMYHETVQTGEEAQVFKSRSYGNAMTWEMPESECATGQRRPKYQQRQTAREDTAYS